MRGAFSLLIEKEKQMGKKTKAKHRGRRLERGSVTDNLSVYDGSVQVDDVGISAQLVIAGLRVVSA
jgi:hypothetical protein